MEKKIWFKAKHYGWGWYPCTWQGWLVLLIWLIVLFTIVGTLDKDNSSVTEVVIPYLIKIFIIVSVLIYICYKKGEKPGWRWGAKDESKKS